MRDLTVLVPDSCLSFLLFIIRIIISKILLNFLNIIKF